MRDLTDRQRAFIDAYLAPGPTRRNATRAARAVGYAVPNVSGHRVLNPPLVSGAIAARSGQHPAGAEASGGG